MTTARQIADAHWGGDPCGGAVTIDWATASPTINATATWSNPTDPYANPSQNTGCRVDFNDSQAFDWPMLCTVFVHEFGHLMGQQHSTDSNDVMFAYYTKPLDQCASTPDPGAIQRPAPPPPPPPPSKPSSKAGQARPATAHHKTRRRRASHRHKRRSSHSRKAPRQRR